MTDPVPAITLDAHGVLLLPDPAAMREALVPFDTEPDEDACWRAHFQLMHVLDRTSEPEWVTINQLMASALGVPDDQLHAAGPVVAETYLSRRWVAVPDAAAALARLASIGYSLAVIANSTHGQVEQVLAETGLCSTSGSCTSVVAVLDSHVVGIDKPDRRIFESALAALGTTPSQCTHIGDSIPLDVAAAEAVGVTPIHIDPYRLCPSDGHAHARSLAAFTKDLRP